MFAVTVTTYPACLVSLSGPAGYVHVWSMCRDYHRRRLYCFIAMHHAGHLITGVYDLPSLVKTSL